MRTRLCAPWIGPRSAARAGWPDFGGYAVFGASRVRAESAKRVLFEPVAADTPPPAGSGLRLAEREP